jgi:cyclase
MSNAVVIRGNLQLPEPSKPMPRVIPCLLLDGQRLVKTVKFRDAKYIGDPLNAVRIFNEKEVDELVFLDIGARRIRSEPDFGLIESLAQQCFMPFAYGGGVRTLEHIRRILTSGAEKVVINTASLEQPYLIREAAHEFGSQSIVLSMDIRRNWFGSWRLFDALQNNLAAVDPVEHAKSIVALGAGEILVNDMDRDGTRDGYDLALVSALASAVNVPVVACGGANTLDDMRAAIDAGASAVAAGSMFVLYGKHRAVLITYPERELIQRSLG